MDHMIAFEENKDDHLKKTMRIIKELTKLAS